MITVRSWFEVISTPPKMSQVEPVLRSQAAKGSGNPRRIGTWGSGNTAAGNGVGAFRWFYQLEYTIYLSNLIYISTQSTYLLLQRKAPVLFLDHFCKQPALITTWQPCFTLARENSFAFCLIPPWLVSTCFNHRFKHIHPDFGSVMLGWKIEHVPPARRPKLQHFATMLPPVAIPYQPLLTLTSTTQSPIR